MRGGDGNRGAESARDPPGRLPDARNVLRDKSLRRERSSGTTAAAAHDEPRMLQPLHT